MIFWLYKDWGEKNLLGWNVKLFVIIVIILVVGLFVGYLVLVING